MVRKSRRRTARRVVRRTGRAARRVARRTGRAARRTGRAARRTGRTARRTARAARRTARRAGRRTGKRSGRKSVNVSKTLTLPEADDDWDVNSSKYSTVGKTSKKGLEDVADDFMDKFGDLAAKGVKQAADAVKPKKSKGKKGKPSEYNLFVKKMIPELKKKHPGKKHKDLFKLVGEAWKKQK